jgi:hypothetical protein
MVVSMILQIESNISCREIILYKKVMENIIQIVISMTFCVYLSEEEGY